MRRSVVFYLSGGRTVRAERFAQAMNLPHVSGEEPLGFRADIAIGKVVSWVSLNKLTRLLVQPVSETQFRAVGEVPQLKFIVEPSDSQFGQELFGALENWAAEFAPSTWERTWSKLKLPSLLLLQVPWISTAFFWGIAGGIPWSSGTVDYRREAHALLEQGINENNERKAIEVLLAITSQYEPGSHIRKFGRTYWGIFVAGTAVLGMLWFCQTVVIGVWKSKQKLTRWRWWMRTVSVTVPAVVITGVLLPKVLSLFGI